MLKGHTKIELTNVNTGEVEVIEKDNMVTNALNKIFAVEPWCSKSIDTFQDNNSNHIKNFLGGLLLFDEKIDEDANTIYAPTNVKMTGNASYGYGNVTENNTRGSYNSTESSFDYSGKKATFVYDFTTAQANGKISSVCLTSRRGGVLGYGMESRDGVLDVVMYGGIIKKQNVMTTRNTIDSNAANYNFILYVDKDYAYITDINEDGKTSSIYKRSMGATKLSVFTNNFELADRSAWMEKVGDFTLSSQLSYKNWTYLNTDVKNHKAYFMYNSNKIAEIDYITATAKEYNISTLGAYYLSNTQTACVYDGFFYYQKASNGGAVYKAQLGNLSNVIQFKGVAPSTKIADCHAYVNGWIIFKYNGGYGLINTEKNTVYYSELSSDNSTASNRGSSDILLRTNFTAEDSVYNVSLLFQNMSVISRLDEIKLIPNYLATINNLEESVTKTADKTMKITYTITEQ